MTWLISLLLSNWMCPISSDQNWPHSILVIDYLLMELSYTPRSDFSLRLKNVLTHLIICEVVSKYDESDRYRMLLQAVVAARVAKYLLKDTSDTFVVMAIYITKEFAAERYLVSRVASDMVYLL
jgi:hypothetical protein